MRSICLVKVDDLVRSLRVQNPQKKAVAAKKRQQACCRPPPVCDSRQLNSRLKKNLPNQPNHQRGADAENWKHWVSVAKSWLRWSKLLFFLWGLTPSPHPYARSATLTKRDAKIKNFHISKFFLTSVSEGNNFFLVLAHFTSPKQKSFRLSTPAFKKNVDRS